MIPLGDVIPVRTRPYATCAAILATIAGGGPILQLGANVVLLGIFGRTVEDRLGHGRFTSFAVLCGGIAAFAQTMAAPDAVLVAAMHGMVASVLGGYFVQFPHSKVLLLVPAGLSAGIVELPAFLFLGIWYMLQVVGGLGSMGGPVAGLIPSWAHLAGFAAGAALVRVFRCAARDRVEWWSGAQER
jgi:membrane associated rhomboid family serine protease